MAGLNILPLIQSRFIGGVGVPHAGLKPWNAGREPELGDEGLIVAGVGDVHGHLRKVERALDQWERRNPCHPISITLQVGDLEAHRNMGDVFTMVAPGRYRVLGDYQLFHTGHKLWPVPMLTISGNHEPHGHLERDLLGKGGQIAENITYGGRLFRQEWHGVTIAGLSGIFGKDYYSGHRPTEFPQPVMGADAGAWRPWVYFTADEIEEAKMLFQGANILVVHDWPAHLVELLDPYTIRGSLNKKARQVGNEPVFELLEAIKPDILLCGHHHQFLSGQIFWRSGEITEVVCLDRFGGNGRVKDMNLVAMLLTHKGVRVLYRFEPKVQTEELKGLRRFMTDQDKSFEFAVDTGAYSETNVKEQIALRLTRGDSQWSGQDFTHGGFVFTLVENDRYDAELSGGDVYPHIYARYYLRLSPQGDPQGLNPVRVLAMARKVRSVLQDLNFNPTLLAEFSDHVD